MFLTEFENWLVLFIKHFYSGWHEPADNDELLPIWMPTKIMHRSILGFDG
jgi:hypothetical protein